MDGVLAAAGTFGAVEGEVGIAEQVVGWQVGRAVEGDPEAGTDPEVAAFDGDRCLQTGDDPGGDLGCLFERADVFKQDRELVAAEPRDGVAGAHPAA